MDETMKENNAKPYIIIIGTQEASPKKYQPDLLLKTLFQVAAFKFSASYRIVVVGTEGASIGDWNKEEMKLDYDNKEIKHSADLAHSTYKDKKFGSEAYLTFFNFNPPLMHEENFFMHPGFVPWLVLYTSVPQKVVPFWKVTDCLLNNSAKPRICLVSYNNKTCKVEADNLLTEMLAEIWDDQIRNFGFLHT